MAIDMTARPYGVLGRKLAHSYTPDIYRELADMFYVRFEREPEDVEDFIRGDDWEGVNVTIPYKRVVFDLVDELTDVARRLGNVNTVCRTPEGKLLGDNTDYYGFKTLVEHSGVDVAGKRVLVFGGSGGAGTTSRLVLEDLGAEVVSVGRTGEVTYEDLPRFADAAVAVNATPRGMFPACPDAPAALDALPRLEAVLDLVYNPARTGIMMEAERRGIPAFGGLIMLVAQAAAAVRRYTGQEIFRGRVIEVTESLSRRVQNIALIGMPGCGKTSVGAVLADILGREQADIDQELERMLDTSCESFIVSSGEDAFRAAETTCVRDVAKRSSLVISCGGGVVTRDENYPLLHQNSLIVMLNRPLEELSRKGRPMTARHGVEELARQRMDRYRGWADLIVDSRESATATAEEIARIIQGAARDCVDAMDAAGDR